MADTVSKSVRSRIMSRIRGTGNERTESAFARLLRQHGFKGWRRHITIRLADARDARRLARFKKLKLRPWVRPDFIFPKQRVAIFIDGCFWHGCPRCYRRPRSNRSFWAAKVTRNRARDRAQTTALRKIGWRVIRLWEHNLQRLHPETLRQLNQ